MASNTTTLNLYKTDPITDGENTFNIGTMLNDNWDKIDTEMKKHINDLVYETAAGTATAITLTNVTLENGHSKTFIASANNNGSATTINNKKLYKPNTTTAPTLILGKAYTVWYSATGDSGNGCFFIKASAEGTASASDVLASKTFTNDSDVGLTGTLSLTGNATDANVLAGQTYYNIDAKTKRTGNMVNNGAGGTVTPTTTDQTKSAGYYSSAITIKGDAALLASNIRSGVSIFNVLGTYNPVVANMVDTTTANAPTAAQILSGKVVFANGASILGTMANNGSLSYTPSNAAQTIPVGYTSGGSVAAVAVDATKVLAGTTIAGTAGTMISKVGSATVIAPSAVDQIIPAGFYGGASGDGKVAAVAVDATKVLTGTTIAGTAGTMANNGAVVITPSTVNQTIGTGFHNGSGYVVGDSDLVASNIVDTANIFGVQGSAVVGKRMASGTATSSSNSSSFTKLDGGTTSVPSITVTGLTFKPSIIYVQAVSDGYIAIYEELAGFYPKQVKTGNTWTSSGYSGSGTSYILKADVSPCSITSTGFTIPFLGATRECNWVAYE